MPLQTTFIFMQRYQKCLVIKLKISASIQIQGLCQFVSVHYRRILVATLPENQLLFFLPPVHEIYDLLSLPKEFHPSFYVIIFNMESLSSPPPQAPKITVNDSLIVPDTLGLKVNESDINSLTNQLLSHCFDARVLESLFKSETSYDIIGPIKSLEVTTMDRLLKSLGGVRDPEHAKVVLVMFSNFQD
ncbi:hypothetical protein BKA69DRAFT_1088151 [Paraphysoderma sedebokerense]|nr:hypothetical protein BKA69DRAFT_1088012 [Paraphysoderma sedebokerense]KAI9139070.1 hypothetical protein BKA69DRAFT_1088151 [Paraphysoderma sedebokerense]